MIEIRCDFCGTKTAKEFNHKVEIKPWYNPRVAGYVYHREFDCCEDCAKAIEHRLITIENNYLWRGKDPNRRYKNWFMKMEQKETVPKADYETRLKADMAAMLTDIQLEIEEIRTEEPINNGHGICGWEGKWAEDIIQECSKIIQEKINSLKEKSDVC